MKKLAIIGASYLQAPLIIKAKELGIETHVFAWAANDVGETIADYFYPISIIEKDEILKKCRDIGIDGICSIASDLAMLTVNYVADKLCLTANSEDCTKLTTNKHLMRERFKKCGNPSPDSYMIDSLEEALGIPIKYPAIVKPLDRSGSRGITKINSVYELQSAIDTAKQEGFDKHVLIEEFAEGDEYSVEYISWQGQHHFLAVTKKYTTGSPHFIERGHIEPAQLPDEVIDRIKKVVSHALDSLEVRFGASHSELKIDDDGTIRLIEIGGRMGGDFIGSHLVFLSTGFDFVKAVVQVALGEQPDFSSVIKNGAAGIRYICSNADIDIYHKIEKDYPDIIVEKDIPESITGEVRDSSTRFGYFVMRSSDPSLLVKIMSDIEEQGITAS